MAIIITLLFCVPYLLTGMALWATLFSYEADWIKWITLVPFTLLWFPLAVLLLLLDKLKLI
jgi:hypothetical protein